jgi:hypothetical protein
VDSRFRGNDGRRGGNEGRGGGNDGYVGTNRVGLVLVIMRIPYHTGLRTGSHRATRAPRISFSWYSLVTITKRVYESLAHRVSPEGGSGRLLHLFRFVVLSGTVCGQDDLEGPQAIESARARRVVFGHAAQEICQHQRVHVFFHV